MTPTPLQEKPVEMQGNNSDVGENFVHGFILDMLNDLSNSKDDFEGFEESMTDKWQRKLQTLNFCLQAQQQLNNLEGVALGMSTFREIMSSGSSKGQKVQR